jgi:flagellin
MAANTDVTRVAGNIGALNTLNSLNSINKQLAIHQTRLASGKRINSAADDPAGLTIATKMQARSNGLSTALANIGDAQNMLAVGEAGVGRINDILVEMRSKALTGASDTMGDDERKAIGMQISDLAKQIDDVVDQTTWNGKGLITGNATTPTSFTFQTGADSADVLTFTAVSNLKSATLTVNADLSTSTVASDFTAFLTNVDAAIKTVSLEMTKLGTTEARLNYKADQATSAQSNVEAAYNRIMNADMASEQVNASKFSILQQTSTAMLSQANSAPQFLLSLFR